MKILSIGQFSADGVSNTCLHRNWALKKLGDVVELDSTFKWNFASRVFNVLYRDLHIPFSYVRRTFNRRILQLCDNERFDIIWIDKGNFVLPSTLKRIKKENPSTIIVGYSPDNMAERHNRTVWFERGLKYYDWFITTKSYIVDWFKSKGCPNVLFVNNAYEDTFHKQYEISPENKRRLGGTIGFIGSWEKERCEYILYLAENGVKVRVWGGGKWKEYADFSPNLKIEDTGLFSEEYNKAISAFDISLCFLRKINHDLQTTRSIEIPACGSLLMAERTNEHLALFEEDKEAIFFSSKEELLEKCRFYLENDDKRRAVAEAGHNRCKKSGYSNYETIKRALAIITGQNGI